MPTTASDARRRRRARSTAITRQTASSCPSRLVTRVAASAARERPAASTRRSLSKRAQRRRRVRRNVQGPIGRPLEQPFVELRQGGEGEGGPRDPQARCGEKAGCGPTRPTARSHPLTLRAVESGRPHEAEVHSVEYRHEQRDSSARSAGNRRVSPRGVDRLRLRRPEAQASHDVMGWMRATRKKSQERRGPTMGRARPGPPGPPAVSRTGSGRRCATPRTVPVTPIAATRAMITPPERRPPYIGTNVAGTVTAHSRIMYATPPSVPHSRHVVQPRTPQKMPLPAIRKSRLRTRTPRRLIAVADPSAPGLRAEPAHVRTEGGSAAVEADDVGRSDGES